MAEGYDAIISLGGHCKPAWHIRERFGIARAMPFDWWIVGTESVARILEEGHADLFDAASLQTIWDGTSVLDTRSGIIHHHDFTRDAAGAMNLPLDVQIPTLKQKFDVLFRRLDDTCAAAERILFVHAVPGHDVRPDNSDEVSVAASARRLHGALTRRFPSGEIDLLFLDGGPGIPQAIPTARGTIVFDNASSGGDPADQWLTGAYRALFDRHRTSLSRPAETPMLDDMLQGEKWR